MLNFFKNKPTGPVGKFYISIDNGKSGFGHKFDTMYEIEKYCEVIYTMLDIKNIIIFQEYKKSPVKIFKSK